MSVHNYSIKPISTNQINHLPSLSMLNYSQVSDLQTNSTIETQYNISSRSSKKKTDTITSYKQLL